MSELTHPTEDIGKVISMGVGEELERSCWNLREEGYGTLGHECYHFVDVPPCARQLESKFSQALNHTHKTV